MARHALVILNPVAGRTRPERLRAAIDRAFTRHGTTYELRETEGDGDALRWARDARDVDLVVAVGGDGTVMEALSGLVEARRTIPLAQVPTGTANLLAVALGIPHHLDRALAIAVRGPPAPFDIGYLPELRRYFALAVGVGWNAQVVEDASRGLKRRFGVLAYVWTGLQNLFRLRRSSVRVEVDGEVSTFRAHSVMIVNVGDVFRNGVRAGRAIDPHDGRLEVAVLSADTFVGLVRLGFGLLTRDLARNRDTPHFTARRVRVEADPPLPVQIDGEAIGTTPVVVEVVANGVELVVPRAYARKHGLAGAGERAAAPAP